MRQAILLGNPESKRSIYLKKAMEEAGLSLLVLDVQKIEEKLLAEFLAKEIFLKIDPPVWKSSSILELPELMEGYKGELMALAALDGKNPITFFNHPSAITALLDKRSCKEVLAREGISVTESRFLCFALMHLYHTLHIAQLQQFMSSIFTVKTSKDSLKEKKTR